MSDIPEFNNKKLPPLEDIAKELHTIKHELFKGLMNDFKGFTMEYERARQERAKDRELLNKIHEATLEGQYHPRLVKLETFREENMHLRADVVALNTRLVVIEAKAVETDRFQTTVTASLSVLKWLLGGSLVATLSLVITLIKLFTK